MAFLEPLLSILFSFPYVLRRAFLYSWCVKPNSYQQKLKKVKSALFINETWTQINDLAEDPNRNPSDPHQNTGTFLNPLWHKPAQPTNMTVGERLKQGQLQILVYLCASTHGGSEHWGLPLKLTRWVCLPGATVPPRTCCTIGLPYSQICSWPIIQ